MRSRRSFLNGALAVAAAALPVSGQARPGTAATPPAANPEHAPTPLSSETRRFRDAATENVVLRLTEPAYQSRLLSVNARPFLQRGNAMLYASDRTGTWQAYRLDTRSGQSRPVTQAAALIPSSLALSPDERTLYYIDGESVRQRPVGSGASRERTIEQLASGWTFGETLIVNDDNSSLAIVDRFEGQSRLRVLPVKGGSGVNRLQLEGKLLDVAFRPRSTQLSCRHADGTLWLLSQNAAAPVRIGQEEGTCGPSQWSADGQSLFYLHYPLKGVHTIREYQPDSKEDRLVAPTSQFVQFARNADSSVFVGLSGSKASPYVLLLVRKARRELTLCEHRTTTPSDTPVLFSPSSQRIYFETDRFGKTVLMSMVLEHLVENTSPDQ